MHLDCTFGCQHLRPAASVEGSVAYFHCPGLPADHNFGLDDRIWTKVAQAIQWQPAGWEGWAVI